MGTFRPVRILLSTRIAPALLLLFALLSTHASGETITFSAGDGDLNYTNPIVTRTVGPIAFTFSGGNSVGGLKFESTTYPPGGIYALDGTTTGNNVKLTIAIQDDYIFDLNSFQAGVSVSSGSIGITLTYADNSTASFTTTVPSGSIVTLSSVLSSFEIPITNVKQVVLSSDDFGVFQDFEVANIRPIPPLPTATTGLADPISASGATLHGTVNGRGDPTTVSFQYGLTSGYGSSASATPSSVSGSSNTSVSVSLSGLSCNTTYHYRVLARNGGGATPGADGSFTTAACPPTVTTGSASSISATGASLAGTVADNGATTTVSFEYGTTASYGSSLAATPGTVSAGSGSTAVSAALSGLSCNTTYHFRLKGVNSAGTTNGSDASFATSACVPGAPRFAAATAGDGQATVTFSAPSSNGGATITSYRVTSAPGGLTATGNVSPITVTGLTNGTSYTFTVTATNSAGTGTASAASNSVTPKASQTITFVNPGAQNFGTTPTLTATSNSGLTVSFTSSTTGVCTITSGGALTFISAGACTIDADQAGNSVFAAANTVSRSFTVNAVVPGAPTIGTATAGDAQAFVAFTAPAFTGGASITRYTVTANPGGATGTGATSPITVPGLTNGVAYTFTVWADNSAGTGSASAASNSVTPRSPQTITFANPGARNFGTTPTLTASSSSGLTPTFTSSTNGVCTITSGGALTFVTAGTCTINADQAGNSSYVPAPQVSRSFTVNAVVPGAPTIGTATAGDTQALVAFTAPAFTGGASITRYTVTANPGGLTGTGTVSPIPVTGLTNGTAYTFTVTATNYAGTGSASAASNSVTPQRPQTITFANPGAQNFGTTPTLAATSDSGLTVTFSSSTTGVCSITSGGTLAFGTTGTCTINAAQSGNASYLAAETVTQSFSVNAVVPGAPSIGTATAGGASATVSFSAPLSYGGANVDYYRVTAIPGGVTATGTSVPIRVTGLTIGTAYTFTVAAHNSVGYGAESAVSNSVTPYETITRTVNNTDDSGTESLRQTIADANAGDTIAFAPSLNGKTIVLTSPLVISKDLTISGPGAANLTISGGDAVQLFQILGKITFALQDLTLANGRAISGGALADNLYSTTKISGCVFRGNRTSGAPSSGVGGAISGAGNISISDSLFTSNQGYTGGAINLRRATLALNNVTLTGNTASSGGAIFVDNSIATIRNTTIAGNSASQSGGGILIGRGTVTLGNSIVANNTAANGPDIRGATFSSEGYNLVKNKDLTTFSATDIIGLDPMLGVLADNGGPTQTLALLAASPAIDAIPSGTSGCGTTLTADQRGMARPQGSSCDMGAYERGLPASLTATAGTPQTAAAGSTFATQLQTKVVDAFDFPLDGVTVSFTGPVSGASITSGGSAQTNASGIAAYTVTANAAAGAYTVTASVDSLSASYSLTNLQLAQSIGPISFAPATITVGGNTTVSASASSSLPVVFSSATPAVCTVSGTTVTGVAAGTCTILANQAGDATYSAAPEVTGNIAVSKATQTIDNISFSPATLTVGGTTTAAATASSGLPVDFGSETPAVCSVSGTTVTGLTVGTCTIAATQVGDSNYTAATLSRDLAVTYADAPPALIVSALSDGATTSASTQNISGKASDPSGIRSVTVNGTAVSVSIDGTFTYPVQLLAGQNTITVVATNNAGISATDTRRITLDSTYPALSVTYPADNATLVKQVVTVTGTVESLLNAAVKTGALHAYAETGSGVTVTYSINEAQPQAATISGGTYAFTADLDSGMNTIRVFASTTEGRKVEAKRTVSYAPGFTLTVTNPAEDARTPLSSYTLTGAVADNDTPVTISIAVDGKTFTPRVTNGVFQQELSFAEARVYPVTITGVDQNGTTVTVVRNIIRSSSSEGASTTFTIEDALLAMKMALGIAPSTASEVLRLDVAPMVNGVSIGDGRIDIEDAVVILRIATSSLQ